MDSQLLSTPGQRQDRLGHRVRERSSVGRSSNLPVMEAGEDYRGWYEDPNCSEHRQYLLEAEQALVEARSAAPTADCWRWDGSICFTVLRNFMAHTDDVTPSRSSSRPGRRPCRAMREAATSSRRRQNGLRGVTDEHMPSCWTSMATGKTSLY